MLTEYHIHEMVTLSERHLWNALKFGTTSEVDTKEGVAPAEGLLLPPPNCNEVLIPQVELNGAVGEVQILQTPMQSVRTKLIFDVRIDNPLFDLWSR